MSSSAMSHHARTYSSQATTSAVDDEDNISLTSTVPDDSEKEYEVERIIYEMPSELGESMYLVKWAGYEDMENTWEPETSFIDQSTLSDWEERLKAIRLGRETSFDIDEWQTRKDRYDEKLRIEKKNRQARRRAKRRRLGIDVPPVSSEDDVLEAMDIDENRPSTRHRRGSSGTEGSGEFVLNDEQLDRIDFEDEQSRPRRQRQRSVSTTDSLLEEMKSMPGLNQESDAKSHVEKSTSNEPRTPKETTSLKQLPIAKGPQVTNEPRAKHVFPGEPNTTSSERKKAVQPAQEPSKTSTQTPKGTSSPQAQNKAQKKDRLPQQATQNRPGIASNPARPVRSGPGPSTSLPLQRKPAGSSQQKPGTGQLAKRTGHVIQRVKAPGRNILENWDARPKTRKRKLPAIGRPPPPDAKPNRLLSARNRINRRAYKEATPDINAMELRRPGESFVTRSAFVPRPTSLRYTDRSRHDVSSATSEDRTSRANGDRSARGPGDDDTRNGTATDDELFFPQENIIDEPTPWRIFSTNRNSGSINPDIPSEYARNLRMEPRPALSWRGHGYPYPDDEPIPPWPFDESLVLSKSKHFIEPNSILCTFFIFGRKVGDVLIKGLDYIPARHAMMRLKIRHQIRINFGTLISVDQYKKQFLSNVVHSNGWVKGFFDTKDECNKLSMFLRQNNLAAVWNHPYDPNRAIVLYHQDSGAWDSIFEEGTTMRPETVLRAAMRPRLQSVTDLPEAPNKALTQDVFFLFPEVVAQESIGAPTAPHHLAPPLELSPPPPPPPPPKNEFDCAPGYPPEEEAQVNIGPPQLAGGHLSEDAMSSLRDRVGSATGPQIDQIFLNLFGIDFNRVAKLHGGEKAENFMLSFGNQSVEEELMRMWLRPHGVNIFSLRDYKEYCKGERPLCIFLHQRFFHIDRIYKLAFLLSKHTNVWRVSLKSPIVGDDEQRRLIRLFPQGGAFFLTEDLMINDPYKSLQILKWFKTAYFPKNKRGWKLVFRPAIKQWLIDTAKQTMDFRYLRMLQLIKEMIPYWHANHENWRIPVDEPEDIDGETDDDDQSCPIVSIPHLPKYGSRQEDDNPKILKGLTQEDRNKDHLVEYFAGWALYNCERLRKFTIITRPPFQERWRKWYHLTILTPEEFSKQWKFDLGTDGGPMREWLKDKVSG